MKNNFAFDLLYPAYQKFYNALSHLERFSIGSDLFDNISSLDSFFAEYKHITNVLKHSLSIQKEYMDRYLSIEKIYLKDDLAKRMADVRNGIVHDEPYALKKKIVITIYSPNTSFIIFSKEYCLLDEEFYSNIEQKLKDDIKSLNCIEIHFSIEYIYYENDSENIFEDIIESISQMFFFLQKMEEIINEESILVRQMKEKIKKLSFYKIPRNCLFIHDHVYFADQNRFEISQRAFISFGNKEDLFFKNIEDFRSPIISLKKIFPKVSNNINDVFEAFFFLHLVMYQSADQSVMPTFMIVYEDDTYSMISSLWSIRTTLYREVNRIANLIKNNKIKAVFFTCESYTHFLDNKEKLYSMSYPERSKFAEQENFSFYMVNQNLESKCFNLDQQQILDMKYVVKEMINSHEKSILQIEKSFLAPIANAFNKKRE